MPVERLGELRSLTARCARSPLRSKCSHCSRRVASAACRSPASNSTSALTVPQKTNAVATAPRSVERRLGLVDELACLRKVARLGMETTQERDDRRASKGTESRRPRACSCTCRSRCARRRPPVDRGRDLLHARRRRKCERLVIAERPFFRLLPRRVISMNSAADVPINSHARASDRSSPNASKVGIASSATLKKAPRRPLRLGKEPGIGGFDARAKLHASLSRPKQPRSLVRTSRRHAAAPPRACSAIPSSHMKLVALVVAAREQRTARPNKLTVAGMSPRLTARTPAAPSRLPASWPSCSTRLSDSPSSVA